MDQPKSTLTDMEERWPVLGTTDLHRDDWVVALRADTVRPPEGTDDDAFRRIVLEHPGAVVVLAIDDRGRACCLRQYRHAAGRRFVELPAGLCDEPGEDPLEVGRRELREEAALAAGSWHHLGATWSSPGISTEQMTFYLARDLAPADRQDFAPEHEEADMQVLWVPFEELRDAVLAGRVADAPLVQAVLLVHARGLAPGPDAGE